MASYFIHSVSSAKKFGGIPDDYLEIHKFLDSTKMYYPKIMHRAILHNSFGMDLCVKLFGDLLTNSDGKVVMVREVAEQHIIEDCGIIPTIQDWVCNMILQPWMSPGFRRKLNKEKEAKRTTGKDKL